MTIVTPWRNHRELERDYWQTIRQAGAPCQVLVVDDGSDPLLPNGVRVSPGRGFAHACNVGLELVRTDAVLFLNNDVAVSEPGWLTRLCAALEPGVLVGAELRHDRHGDVDGIQLPYLDGWCLAGMTADLRALGGFDEGYQEPSYFGDNDLALRARLAGMILREVKVGLSHKRNVTAGPGSDPRVLAATRANQLRFQALVRDLLEVTA